MLIDDLDSIPEMFKNGVRGIVLLYRSKDGEKGNAQRRAIKKISRNVDEWHNIVREFRELQLTSYHNHRIYASVNSRNMGKAIHEFKLRQVGVDYGNDYELHWFYTDIQNRFFSCLMNPNTRNSRYFLIDCDSEEEYEHALLKLPVELILFTYPTKNGWHIISKPFNPNEILLEPKKDEMMFVG